MGNNVVTIVNKHTHSTACSSHRVARAPLCVPDDARTGREGGSSLGHLVVAVSDSGRIKPRRIGGESRRRGAIMPGHLQEGFGCVVTNRFDQLLDDESDPFEILKAAENKKKEGAAAGSAKTAAQAAKQPKKESQKDRKNPLLDKKEESQAPVPLKKEGKYGPRGYCLKVYF